MGLQPSSVKSLIERSSRFYTIIKGRGGGGRDEFVKELITQERRVAMLDRQSVQNSGESSLIFRYLTLKILQQNAYMLKNYTAL